MKGGLHGLGALVLLFVGCGIAGCDEPPKAEKPPEAAKQAAPPAVVPAPVPEPEPAQTPTKKLEDCEPGPKVVLSNSDVEAHIRMKAQKPEGDITTHDLGKMTSVNFSRVALDTLDTCMFVHMKNLKEIFLGPGQVWDLSPLASLASLANLETVRVAGNPVEDLSPLALMIKMDRLDVGDTKVKDISPLKNMNRLTEVTLDGSLVEDISALKNASDLEILSIRRTQIKSLEPLSESKNLKQLFIAESAIASDIAATGVVTKNGTKVISE